MPYRLPFVRLFVRSFGRSSVRSFVRRRTENPWLLRVGITIQKLYAYSSSSGRTDNGWLMCLMCTYVPEKRKRISKSTLLPIFFWVHNFQIENNKKCQFLRILTLLGHFIYYFLMRLLPRYIENYRGSTINFLVFMKQTYIYLFS